MCSAVNGEANRQPALESAGSMPFAGSKPRGDRALKLTVHASDAAAVSGQPWQGKDMWTSTHFVTGVVGLVLLGLQGMLSAFFEVCALHGSGHIVLLWVHCIAPPGSTAAMRVWCMLCGAKAAVAWQDVAGARWTWPGLQGLLFAGVEVHQIAPATAAGLPIAPLFLQFLAPSTQDDPNARGLHAYFGTAILALFVWHGALGLQLGLSL